MFRKAALEANRSRTLGEVVIAQPPSAKIFTAFSTSVGVALLAIFTMGSYTQHASVVGRLIPQGGIAKVSSPFHGTIKEKHVVDGQSVKAGDTLYVISGERRDSNGNATLATVIDHISVRRHQLLQELSALEKSQLVELRQWRQHLASQSQEITKYDDLIAAQRKLVILARENANRYRRLAAMKAVSTEQADNAQADFHEKQSRLYTLERHRLIASRARTDAEETLALIPHKHQQARSQLKRTLSKVSQELAENEAAREFAIIAPIDGTATAVVAHIGQRVINDKPLVSIVPHDQPLEAHLYVQSHAVGHLKTGAPVRLRYHAFPYQSYGVALGHILSISEASSPREELSDTGSYDRSTEGPLYLVKVRLQHQSVEDGRRQVYPLRAGMLLDANVARETRRVYEWAFAPLYRLRDKL
ncbi:HlyD family secretion protein [Bordetella genomosp. 9]|uniref:HlyD family secretion protein n=1 Tax=Bordetella genomosp. 9 TaxID=1416803 RepID=UPI0018DF7724|nr:HlyD family efflux transporter periplasmic adaptor subunit [Bordetella genomosp. 9]